MKRVGILTYHYINNYGAALQAYALQKYIDDMEGYSSEIINYIPKGFVYYPYECGKLGAEKMQTKMDAFHSFLEQYCNIKQDSISNLSSCYYDIYCVGSDQVWNHKINNNDCSYLLEGVGEGRRKISYASSIGLPINEICLYSDVLKKNLKDFYRVSVREQEHADWLKNKCNIDCETVLDPTFLLEEKDYDPIITAGRIQPEKFVLFIWYPHDDQLTKAIEFVNTVSRKYGLPIVHNLLNVRPYILAQDGGYMFYEGVGEFLWYIKNAEMIVTNSYHTMLFSMHFRKPFYVFLVESMRSRFDSMAHDFGLGDRFVTGYMGANEINNEMDYKNIYKCIEPYREKSKEYLQRALT